MAFLFVNRLFSENIINALSWTFIHSLWQGMILAVLAAFVITWTKRSSANTRYNLILLLFVLFVGATVVTFIRELSTATATGAIFVGNGSATANGVTGTGGAALGAPPSYFNRMVSFLTENASLIVSIWFILFCIRFSKVLLELGYIQRLKHYKTREPHPDWTSRLGELARLLRIKRPVSLLESELVTVPSVIGFVKPLILVPAGMMTNLPPDEIEAILLHELAHIRRKDFFVNLLQRFTESFFFFNPAVLWVSTLLREERENCCDDLAVASMNSEVHYINALVNFHQFHQETFAYNTAMAFPGQNRSSLLTRVKRMVTHENKKLNSWEKAVILCGLIIVTFLPLVSFQQARAQQGAGNTATRKDSVPSKSTQVAFPDLNAPKTDDEVYLTTATTTDADGNNYKLVSVGDRRPVFYINDRQITKEKELNKYNDLMDRLQKEIWARKTAADAARTEHNEALAKGVADDLVADRLVENRSALTSFSLTSDQFTVNGRKQSFEVFNRYKLKYIKSADNIISFNEAK